MNGKIIAFCHVVVKLHNKESEISFSIANIEENFDSTVLSYNSPMAKSCIKAISNNIYDFEIEGTKTTCSLINYNIFDEPFILKYRKPLQRDFTQTSEVVWVHRGTLGCQRNNHLIERVNAAVNGLNGEIITISINHCTELDCDRYFISETSLLEYEKKYGILLFHKKPHKSLTEYFDNFERSAQSPLRMYGYSVRQNYLTVEERRMILIYIIDNKILAHYKVIEYLELFININGESSKNVRSVGEWKNDLGFLLNYNSQDNPCITGTLRWR